MMGPKQEAQAALFYQFSLEDQPTMPYADGWMKSVTNWMQTKQKKYVADQIRAESIYGCYYSYSKATGGDLIPSVVDPAKHDWSDEGEARPKKVFAQWLVQNPDDYKNYMPIEISFLEQFRA